MNRRFQWEDLPPQVRHGVERRLGESVTSVVNRTGGFTAGMASVLHTGSAATFVKALPVTDGQADSYRREASFSKLLPKGVPAPALVLDFEAEGWIVLGFEAIEGDTISAAPSQPLAEEVVAMFDRLHKRLTPSPFDGLPGIAERLTFSHWSNLLATGESGRLRAEDLPEGVRVQLPRFARAEARFNELTGETMLHLDGRHDNIIRRRGDGELFLVDWSWPVVGPSWIDVVGYLATCEGDLDREAALSRHSHSSGTDPADIDGFIVGIAGHWLAQSKEPGFAHAPHIREYQATSAANALRWLDQRGWDLSEPLMSL